MASNTPRLLDHVRAVLFHAKRHPRDMGLPEVEAFLTDLAVTQQVAASTQNQALSALLFLYAEVLEQPLAGRVSNVARASSRISGSAARASVSRRSPMMSSRRPGLANYA